jgi:predicted transcriptional regulator
MSAMGDRPFLFWGFRPPRELLRARLGTLEREVIEIVWKSDEVTVRDVHTRLDGRVAYTTVMTTLDRLFRKGLLGRTKRARAFVYSALASREELDDIVASDVVSGLLEGEGSAPLPFLSNLVDAVGERDRALLDELERLVKSKQRELGREGTGPKAGNGPAKREEP